MLPIHAPFARRATESHAQSALPDAPVQSVPRRSPRPPRAASWPLA